MEYPKRNGRPAKRAYGEKTNVFPEATARRLPGCDWEPRESSSTPLPASDSARYAVAAGCGVWGGWTCDGRAL